MPATTRAAARSVADVVAAEIARGHDWRAILTRWPRSQRVAAAAALDELLPGWRPRCAHCGAELPVDRRVDLRYCSARCNARAFRRREARLPEDVACGRGRALAEVASPADAVDAVRLFTQLSYSTTGLFGRSDRPLTDAEWRALGALFGRMKNRLGASYQPLAWWVGDWLFHAEKTNGRAPTHVASALTGIRVSRVRRLQYVAGRINPPSRRSDLTFAHHEAVAPLSVPEQERWLELAVAKDLRAVELARAIDATTRMT